MSGKDDYRFVDELFWLDQAAEFVEQGLEKLDQGGQRVATAMAWFWTAYTTSITAAFAIIDIRMESRFIFWIVAPGISLFAAYALATWASLPIPIQFNVNMPEKIKSAYELLLEKKRLRLRISLWLASLSAVLVAAVSVMVIFLPGRGSDKISILLSKSPEGSEMIMGATFPVETDVLTSVTPSGQSRINRIRSVKADRHTDWVIPVPADSIYSVEISWTDASLFHLVRKEVRP
jgi:hypothetical protein